MVPLQPWLNDLVTCLAAPTQWWSGHDGQTRAVGAQGLWHGDTRVLSTARLTVGGREPSPALVAPADSDEVRVIAYARELGDATADPTVRVETRRRVRPGVGVETIVVTSTASRPVTTEVVVELACDLAPMERVKTGLPSRPITPTAQGAPGWSDGSTTVQVEAPDAEVDRTDVGLSLRWLVSLAPRGSVELEWQARSHDSRQVVVAPADAGTDAWRIEVTADDRRLERWVRRALGDLSALRLVTPELPDDVFVAAGAPWFLTLFGRDSLWAARMLLPLGTSLAGSTLRVLAARQGRGVDTGSAEEPGKILHELRRDALDLSGGLAGGLHLPPVYYGTVDATSLWVCLLHDAWRWGLPAEEVEMLLPHLEAALDWTTLHGDSDGDGFLEYVDSSGRGLSNQGWKDSGDSVQWHTGGLAEAPIALCEVQGYAHEAALGGAAVLEAFGRPGADRWREWAAELAERFRRRFWVEDAEGAYPAIALDSSKRPVDSLTSNIGHLLGTGLLSRDEEAQVAARLAGRDMDSGFGLRTMSSTATGYAPLSYHGGSVWPHDTAIALSGLARGGFHAAAGSLVQGLLAAADAFDGRLPELYGGDAREDVPAPVPYPAACRPQAWSAAAAVVTLAAVTGLRPDVPAGSLDVRPLAPSPVGAARVSGLQVGGRPVEVTVDRDGTVLSAPDPTM
ncbi:amylo-alpha-1,6-glucosidase [Kineosporiaceae bacterium SCSIO 59966]|nr:amylo-alpha-1,6-glucosidase [Kineosporiaceae bacterium SCSIO 59966]